VAYVMGQATVGTVPTLVFNIPAGLCNFTFFQTGSTAATYIGSSTAVSTGNGMVCPVSPGVPFQSYVSSKGSSLYAVSSATVTVSYFMSTDQ
jgi:hypothetical protein